MIRRRLRRRRLRKVCIITLATLFVSNKNDTEKVAPPPSEEPAALSAEPAKEDAEDGAEEGGVKILSKKEKEKLKKEREKVLHL